MYNPNYIQTERVDPSRNSNTLRILGYLLFGASLAFLIMAFYISYFMFIGFGVLVISGFICFVFNNRKTFSYTYAIDEEVIVISKQDMVKKQTRMVQISLKDIEEYTIFADYVKKDDIVAAPDIHSTRVKQIIFKIENVEKRLIFTPDMYLDSVIKKYLKDK